MEEVKLVTNDPYFRIKEDPLEQQILPSASLDQATNIQDVNVVLKLIKVEALIEEGNERLRCEACIKVEKPDVEQERNKENVICDKAIEKQANEKPASVASIDKSTFVQEESSKQSTLRQSQSEESYEKPVVTEGNQWLHSKSSRQ